MHLYLVWWLVSRWCWWVPDHSWKQPKAKPLEPCTWIRNFWLLEGVWGPVDNVLRHLHLSLSPPVRLRTARCGSNGFLFFGPWIPVLIIHLACVKKTVAGLGQVWTKILQIQVKCFLVSLSLLLVIGDFGGVDWIKLRTRFLIHYSPENYNWIYGSLSSAVEILDCGRVGVKYPEDSQQRCSTGGQQLALGMSATCVLLHFPNRSLPLSESRKTKNERTGQNWCKQSGTIKTMGKVVSKIFSNYFCTFGTRPAKHGYQGQGTCFMEHFFRGYTCRNSCGFVTVLLNPSLKIKLFEPSTI